MPVRVQEKPKFKIKIKRNDQVVVIAGKDRGKKGRVLRVLADKNRVLVEGVMMMKKHVKADPQKRTQGGILEQEATIHLSNVMLLDSEGNKTRVGTRIDGDTKVRVAKTNDQPILEKGKAKAKKK
jgi:large subunit ribosomal protein L24